MVIGNRFCSYFSNIGPNLAKKIPALSWIPRYFRTGNFMNTIFFEPVSQLEILEIVKSFRSVTAAACGQWWSSYMCIVKDFPEFIFQPSLQIINLSIESGIVPDQMKIARFIPFLKSGYDSLFSNYRPISVLPIFPTPTPTLLYSALLHSTPLYSTPLTNLNRSNVSNKPQSYCSAPKACDQNYWQTSFWCIYRTYIELRFCLYYSCIIYFSRW